jgi:hypothetical protein
MFAEILLDKIIKKEREGREEGVYGRHWHLRAVF